MDTPNAGNAAPYPFPIPGGCADWDFATLTPRFQLTHQIGRGSFGLVFRALDHSVNPPRAVAIKRVANCVGPGVLLENTRRILREVRILRRLRTDTVVRLIHVCPPSRADYTDMYLVFEKMDSDFKELFLNVEQELSVHHVRFTRARARARHAPCPLTPPPPL